MYSHTEVLNHRQIEHKIQRIAWQIYESHQAENEILLAGIASKGFLLAEEIKKVLEQISPLQINLYKITINKKNPLATKPTIEPPIKELNDKAVLVIDDVLNTGSTLIYGVKYFLESPVKRITTAVLVDRNHKNFPVKADFKGLSLSTSMMEHVEVFMEKEPYSVVVS